jgi:DNA (cytosine-5)-methyltransferase 1
VPQIAEIYKERFPKDRVIVGDAHEYLLKHFQEFDFIWSSPPCVTHSRINKNFGHIRYIDFTLYQQIVLLKEWFEGKFCVENVIPYYGNEGLIIPDLRPQQNGRHLFWCNFKIPKDTNPRPEKQYVDLASNKKIRKTRKKEDSEVLRSKITKHLGIKEISIEKLSFSKDKLKVYKNCLHPKTGELILNSAMGVMKEESAKQTSLF